MRSCEEQIIDMLRFRSRWSITHTSLIFILLLHRRCHSIGVYVNIYTYIHIYHALSIRFFLFEILGDSQEKSFFLKANNAPVALLSLQVGGADNLPSSDQSARLP